MDSVIYLQLEPRNIDMLTRIIEACSHLGVVSTLDRREGLVIIRGTPDTISEIDSLLPELPFKVRRYDGPAPGK
ncbi:MAG: DUF4911 domain-containing protein [Deltaproteobacteria bacterium]